MAYPRAVFPDSLRDEYRTASIRELARRYRSSYLAVRRWLVEHGVALRPQGVRRVMRPNAKADLAPASGAQVQRLVGQTEPRETKP